MIVFDKLKIRETLTSENIFDLLQEFGGDPEQTSFGFISATICHNLPGEGSRKLYYYENTGLFKCYTGCDEFFDPFQLVIKVAEIQWDEEFDLNDAVRWVAQKFGFSGEYEERDETLIKDKKKLDEYNRLQEVQVTHKNKKGIVILKDYDDYILDRFDYDIKITPWLKENISQEAMNQARIGFYPGGDQITIPHYDADGRFIGLRGRTLCQDEAERYGKYRPLKINNELYNHPLGLNLYNFNHSKKMISIMKKAIIFESEKSCLLYKSYFGLENDISVACCGSSISNYQMQLLLDCGVQEIIIALDRQFQRIGDKEYEHLMKNINNLILKHSSNVLITYIYDKKMITDYKASPIDEGADKFLRLFEERTDGKNKN